MNVIMMINYTHSCTEKLFIVNSWIVRLEYLQLDTIMKEDNGRKRGKWTSILMMNNFVGETSKNENL